MKKQPKLAIYLALVTFLCGGLLYYLNIATTPLIKTQEKRTQDAALSKIMPNANKFVIHETKKDTFKALTKENTLTGYVFKVTTIGYAGKIDMLVGITNKKVTGISILKHSETPGLGANLEDFSWQEQFRAKSISDEFLAKKDISVITGSTITSQAVGNGIREAITLYLELTETK